MKNCNLSDLSDECIEELAAEMLTSAKGLDYERELRDILYDLSGTSTPKNSVQEFAEGLIFCMYGEV